MKTKSYPYKTITFGKQALGTHTKPLKSSKNRLAEGGV